MIPRGSISAQYERQLSRRKMFLLAVLLLHVIVGSISTISPGSCDRAKLYGVVPQSEGQVEYLRSLSVQNDTLDFWKLTTLLHEEADVFVLAEDDASFQEDLIRNRMEYFVKNSNIPCLDSPRLERNAQFRSADSLDLRRYMSYKEINQYIDFLARKYADVVTVKTVGRSFEGRPLRTVTISNGQSSRAILIDAGIHAREWIAPVTALYVMNRLIQHADENRDLLSNLTWIILPLVNPDGYEYSFKTNKRWRKTRRPSKRCIGTDGNRNFDFHWAEKGSSLNECAYTFAGPKPFSEPETQAIRNLLLSGKDTIKFYLTLHSYGRMLIYPWGYKKDLPRKWKTMDAVARAGSRAMKQQFNVDYKVGGTAKILYEAAGGSDDYAHGVARIPISITMELPGDDRGFHPAEFNIKPFVEEAFAGIRAMALKVMEIF